MKCFDTFWKGNSLFWNYIFVISSWLKYFLLIHKFTFFSGFKKKEPSNNLFSIQRKTWARKSWSLYQPVFIRQKIILQSYAFKNINNIEGESLSLHPLILSAYCCMHIKYKKIARIKKKGNLFNKSEMSVMLWVTSSDSEIVSSCLP